MERFTREVILFLLWMLHSYFTGAQVTLLPTSVYISDGLGVGSLEISNDTGARQEVSIGFGFAYPGSDEEGHLVMISDDEEAALRYGIDGQIRAFPRSFLLPPGGRQTVRLQVRPLHDRPDGVYWTRVIVTSRTAAEDVDKVEVSEKVGTRIHYVFKQNIPVFFKKGKVSTGLEITGAETEVKSDRLVVTCGLRPTGNAPFNGSVDAILRNSSGQVITRRHTTAVVYFESLRRLELPFPDVVPDQGNYFLELIYRTKRRDIPPSDLVQAPPVHYTVYFRIG
jgi:hypothetical protein